jgi:hypothetical protein
VLDLLDQHGRADAAMEADEAILGLLNSRATAAHRGGVERQG